VLTIKIPKDDILVKNNRWKQRIIIDFIFQGFCIVAALGLLCYLRQRDRYI
jgi:hypothetical protein